jgi:predicted  nucleic acid-binding Zn-ribbon protein
MFVKSSKKSSKEPSLPSQDEARRANVLMEQMLSKFDTFGESLAIVRERVDRIEPKIDKLTERVDVLESAVRTNSRDINALKEAVHGNTEAIHGMQTDLRNINQRLEVVEAKS